MPRLSINPDQFGVDLDIANPNESIKPEDGLWNIFVKTIKLFPETQEGITRRKQDVKTGGHLCINKLTGRENFW